MRGQHLVLIKREGVLFYLWLWLTDKHHRQATLLSVRFEEDEKRLAKLMAAVDAINAKFGVACFGPSPRVQQRRMGNEGRLAVFYNRCK